MHHAGETRSAVCCDHALITPESHVPIALPPWKGTISIVLISRELGAKFAQYLVRCEPGGKVCALSEHTEYLVLVLDGALEISVNDVPLSMQANSWAYLPPQSGWELIADSNAELLVFEKIYQPADGLDPPEVRISALADIPAIPFLGDEGALLQTLLPDGPEWDWGINVFEFVPGGTLPQVESHYMEHGLYMLNGAGVYRLGDCWYTVQAGDSIWMAPYLLQWFAATGKSPTRYVYYKEMNRAPAS